jgi:hypothetical protein
MVHGIRRLSRDLSMKACRQSSAVASARGNLVKIFLDRKVPKVATGLDFLALNFKASRISGN